MYSTTSPYRIITVCTGNICRSPMAALMLTEAFAAEGLGGLVVVDSAGTTGYEVGHPIDPRAARVLTAQHIASEDHIAREWRHEWFAGRDLILALDVDHFGWLQEGAPDRGSLEKVRMLRSFDPKVAGRNTLDLGIEDPWYGGHTDFDNTWTLIKAAIPGIVEHVKSAIAKADTEAGHEHQQVTSMT
ncbi:MULTISPECIES: low molecular weight protein-tyrosine-phosphatase [Paenarthrobacter]|uniref:low molecular weight protein-tyrosine-phosphatase n=1 Tax=Paenarthrobacter TaxID=1742992 RepID=UPI002365E4D6|nr:low molecular weight protein-tyrosine-phosphatase [Paenarthrobacter sp. AB444]MDD7835057.1 low molecular weight phosphotyrosine protein phosphatase [Paenarthrobacter sp. AB444]